MTGSTILHYNILEKLGEGGMGEVYKAQDTKLDRFVALKFLPSQLTASEDDKARFIQEAKAASAINHPNICTIYSIEEYKNQSFISMEYIEGKTLTDKKDSLSDKQKLEIGIQTSEGLAAAHEKGIIHRDIKPDNIMIRKDGIVQIMDFGLAKLYSSGDVGRLTKAGTTLGTMGYMSPEQVQGQDVDHRTDIFSLGVVLYELFAGQSPFKGIHEAALLYEIVNTDVPPISEDKPEIDSELDSLILECLEKDRDERLQSAKELARNLRKLKRGSSGSKASRVFKAGSFSSKENVTLKSEATGFYSKLTNYILNNKISSVIILLLTIVSLILGLLKIRLSTASEFMQPVHFTFDIPPQSNPILNWESVLQISPDGKSIAYTDLSKDPGIISIRDLDDAVSHPLRGTEGAVDPVFENSNWLSFTVNGFMGKIPLMGGLPDISSFFSTDGFSWGRNGEIVSAESWTSGLTFRSGWNGKSEVLTEVNHSKDEGTHLLPLVLPEDNAAVFTIWSNASFNDSKIAVVNLKTKERKNLSYNGVEIQGTSPSFIQPPWGNYLLWSRNGNLYASSFDLSDLKITGPEIKILDALSVNASSGKAAYSVTNANNGTITYITGKLDTQKTKLVWINKNGTETNSGITGPYLMPMIFKNNRALVVLNGPSYKIGLLNFETGNVDLLFTDGDNAEPKITPDAANFVFVSNFEDGKYNVYLKRLDGLGTIKKIVSTEGGFPEISNLSPDGSIILYNPMNGNNKIWIKNIKTNTKPKLLFNSKAEETSPAFSPDGKFIAYRSNEIDGKFRLFIRPFPVNESKIQVSINDGLFPQWSKDGNEIYYREDDNIISARIQKIPVLKVLSRRVIFKTKRFYNFTFPDFAVAPDGRILILKNAIDQSKPVHLNVILNWFTELKKKLVNQN